MRIDGGAAKTAPERPIAAAAAATANSFVLMVLPPA
jgi:hypothetical protein